MTITRRLRAIRVVAADYGVHRETISDLLNQWNIPTYPMPRNAKARGIDAAGERQLRRLLNMEAVAA